MGLFYHYFMNELFNTRNLFNNFFFYFTLALKCGFPGAPAHSTVEFSTPTVEPGTVARYTCDRGFELLGPARRMCGTNGTWVPQGIPFCGEYNKKFFIEVQNTS